MAWPEAVHHAPPAVAWRHRPGPQIRRKKDEKVIGGERPKCFRVSNAEARRERVELAGQHVKNEMRIQPRDLVPVHTHKFQLNQVPFN